MKLEEQIRKATMVANNPAKGVVYVHSPESFEKPTQIAKRIEDTLGDNPIRTSNIKRFGEFNFAPAGLWKHGSFMEDGKKYTIFQLNEQEAKLYVPTTIFALDWTVNNQDLISEFLGEGSIKYNDASRVFEVLEKSAQKGVVLTRDLSLPDHSYLNLLNRLESNGVIKKEIVKHPFAKGVIGSYQATEKGLQFYESFVIPFQELFSDDILKRELLDRWKTPDEMTKLCQAVPIDISYGSSINGRQKMYGLICENPGIKTQELSAQTGFHTNTIKWYVNQLVDKGAIRKEIRDFKAQYFARVE